MKLDQSVLDQLLVKARTHNGWTDRPVADELLHELYELMKWGPTGANCSPARIVFVKSAEAKEKLLPCMSPGNVAKTKAAPVTAVIGMDMEFYEKLPQLFPQTDVRSWYVGNQAMIEATAMRNSSLQGGYFILAARALGLDCGPMGGFDQEKMNAAIFPNSKLRANFVCNLGYGDTAKLMPRNPRLAFAQACRID